MSEETERARQAILEQIKQYPGDSSSAIIWRYLGGDFKGGLAVGMVTVTPSQLIHALGVSSRLTELGHKGRVRRCPNPTNIASKKHGGGYWAVGEVPRQVPHSGRAAVAKVTKVEAPKVIESTTMANYMSVLRSECKF